MNVLVAILAVLVSAEYAVIALDIVPRLTRIARIEQQVATAARWGATAFFLGCATTHAVIAVRTLIPSTTTDMGAGMVGMHMASGGSGIWLVLEMVLPHLAQVAGGGLFIAICKRRLEVQITTKEFAAETRERDRQLRSALDNAPVGVAMAATETSPGYVNRAFLAIFGLPADRPAPPEQDILALIHPSDRGIEAQARDDVEFRIIRPDGAQRWIHLRRGPMLNGESRVTTIVEDVTDRVTTHAALAASERRLIELAATTDAQSFQQAVFSASPDIISVWDFEAESTAWSNRSIGVELGYSLDENSHAHGGLANTLVHPDDRADFDAASAAARDSLDDAVLQLDYRMLAKDGGSRWFSRRTAPLRRDTHGRVTQIVAVTRDITVAMASELQLRHTAQHDSLTGLSNRNMLLDQISDGLAQAAREGTQIGVLVCDLDGFKRINDIGGHAAGDAVLIEVSDRLRRSVRSSDSIARVGGDEFVIILEPVRSSISTAVTVPRHGSDRSGSGQSAQLTIQEIAKRVACRVRAELLAPIDHEGQSYSVSISIGMTFAGRGDVADEVLRDADGAMYLAKQHGRDRFEVFSDELRTAANQRIKVERALRDALQPNAVGAARLSVAYQPVYELAGGRLIGFEALARLTDDVGTSIPSDVFIPVAENCGLIGALGTMVLDQGLAGLTRWHADHPGDERVTLAVNLSARQAHQSDLAADVLRAVSRHGLHPADLILELTESILLDTGSAGMQQLTTLHQAGVGIAIDDFGTGYASLRYLTTLPISSLKVDRSFTARLPTDAVSGSIVRAIAALSAELGLACVVEGIETTEQLQALPVGVQGQGYLLGRPEADFTAVRRRIAGLALGSGSA